MKEIVNNYSTPDYQRQKQRKLELTNVIITGKSTTRRRYLFETAWLMTLALLKMR